MSLRCTMILGDCLEVMPCLDTDKFRFCFADFPYLCTKSRWDVPIDLHSFWAKWRQLNAEKWTLVASATFRFAVALYLSAPELFRYDLVFNKLQVSGFLNAKHSPMRYHENLLVFGGDKRIYNPQREARKPRSKTTNRSQGSYSASWNLDQKPQTYRYTDTILPGSVLPLMGEARWMMKHSAQKPVALLDWLVKTYSNEGDDVLDPCSGSGTTAVSALQNGRHVTCIEKDIGYFEASLERVRKHVRDNSIDAVVKERR